MIEGPGIWWRFHEDEVTRQQVRPGTARRVWPYLRRYRGPMVLLVLMAAVDSAIVVTIPLIPRLLIDGGILRHRGERGRCAGAGRRGAGAGGGLCAARRRAVFGLDRRKPGA
jgi:hypothetical protein